MRRTPATPIAALLLALAPCAGLAAPPGPYDVKSGILEYTSDAFGDGKVVVYFDDYGRREARYSTATLTMFGRTIETRNVEIRTPERSIRYDAEKKTGSVSAGMVPARQDEVPPDAKTRAQYKIEALPDRVILGKTCKGFSAEVMKGFPIRAWTWKGLPMLTQTRLGAGMTKLEIVDMRLDVPVPAEKFQAPGDVALQKQ